MKRYCDLAAGLIVVAASIAIYIFSDNIQRMVVTSIGPNFMPKLVAMIMGVLGIILVLQGIHVVTRCPAGTTKTGDVGNEQSTNIVNLFKSNLDTVTLALLVLYALSIGKMGFLIATSIYMFLQILLMHLNSKRNYLLFGAISVAFTSCIYFIFTKLLYVMLPAGLLG